MSLWLVIGGAVLVAVSLGFAGLCYLELRRWARQCQRARIAIARKGRVALEAPLVDWLTWANTLDGDDATRGRVIFRDRGIAVAILKAAPAPKVAVESRRTIKGEEAPA